MNNGETFSSAAAAWAVIIFAVLVVVGVALITRSFVVFVICLALILFTGAVLRAIEAGKE